MSVMSGLCKKICSRRDLRDAYESLLCANKILEDCKKSQGELKKAQEDFYSEFTGDLKKEIRKFYKKEDEKAKKYLNIFEDDFDGYTQLVALPDEIESKEDGEEWFEENEFIPYIDRGYDCTGQMFTCWYKVFQRQGKWMAYHRVSCDC